MTDLDIKRLEAQRLNLSEKFPVPEEVEDEDDGYCEDCGEELVDCECDDEDEDDEDDEDDSEDSYNPFTPKPPIGTSDEDDTTQV